MTETPYQLTKEARRAIDFEFRATALHGAVLRMGEIIRDDIMELRTEEAWLTQFRSDSAFYRQATTGLNTEAQLRKYYGKERRRIEKNIGYLKARIELAKAELERATTEWHPLRQIAEGMKDALKAAERAEAEAAALVPSAREQKASSPLRRATPPVVQSRQVSR